MKIKKHIKAKRQYVSPSIYVKVLQMESMLAGGSADITGDDFGDGDGEGGNNSKRMLFLEDDEIEQQYSIADEI